MTRSDYTIWCDGCGTEILWSPNIIRQQDFCCQDCADGIKCKCAEIMNWDEEYQDASSSLTTSYFGE